MPSTMQTTITVIYLTALLASGHTQSASQNVPPGEIFSPGTFVGMENRRGIDLSNSNRGRGPPRQNFDGVSSMRLAKSALRNLGNALDSLPPLPRNTFNSEQHNIDGAALPLRPEGLQQVNVSAIPVILDDGTSLWQDSLQATQQELGIQGTFPNFITDGVAAGLDTNPDPTRPLPEFPDARPVQLPEEVWRQDLISGPNFGDNVEAQSSDLGLNNQVVGTNMDTVNNAVSLNNALPKADTNVDILQQLTPMTEIVGDASVSTENKNRQPSNAMNQIPTNLPNIDSSFTDVASNTNFDFGVNDQQFGATFGSSLLDTPFGNDWSTVPETPNTNNMNPASGRTDVSSLLATPFGNDNTLTQMNNNAATSQSSNSMRNFNAPSSQTANSLLATPFTSDSTNDISQWTGIIDTPASNQGGGNVFGSEIAGSLLDTPFSQSTNLGVDTFSGNVGNTGGTGASFTPNNQNGDMIMQPDNVFGGSTSSNTDSNRDTNMFGSSLLGSNFGSDSSLLGTNFGSETQPASGSIGSSVPETQPNTNPQVSASNVRLDNNAGIARQPSSTSSSTATRPTRRNTPTASARPSATPTGFGRQGSFMDTFGSGNRARSTTQGAFGRRQPSGQTGQGMFGQARQTGGLPRAPSSDLQRPSLPFGDIGRRPGLSSPFEDTGRRPGMSSPFEDIGRRPGMSSPFDDPGARPGMSPPSAERGSPFGTARRPSFPPVGPFPGFPFPPPSPFGRIPSAFGFPTVPERDTPTAETRSGFSTSPFSPTGPTGTVGSESSLTRGSFPSGGSFSSGFPTPSSLRMPDIRSPTPPRMPFRSFPRMPSRSGMFPSSSMSSGPRIPSFGSSMSGVPSFSSSGMFRSPFTTSESSFGPMFSRGSLGMSPLMRSLSGFGSPFTRRLSPITI